MTQWPAGRRPANFVPAETELWRIGFQDLHGVPYLAWIVSIQPTTVDSHVGIVRAVEDKSGARNDELAKEYQGYRVVLSSLKIGECADFWVGSKPYVTRAACVSIEKGIKPT